MWQYYNLGEGIEYEHKGSVHMLMCSVSIYIAFYSASCTWQFLTYASEESVVFPDSGTLPPTACGFPLLVAHSQSQEHCQLHLLFRGHPEEEEEWHLDDDAQA